MATIHFSFTCCFRRFLRRSFTGLFPQRERQIHRITLTFTVHYLNSRATWFTNHSNHIHIFTPITRIVATKDKRRLHGGTPNFAPLDAHSSVDKFWAEESLSSGFPWAEPTRTEKLSSRIPLGSEQEFIDWGIPRVRASQQPGCWASKGGSWPPRTKRSESQFASEFAFARFHRREKNFLGSPSQKNISIWRFSISTKLQSILSSLGTLLLRGSAGVRWGFLLFFLMEVNFLLWIFGALKRPFSMEKKEQKIAPQNPQPNSNQRLGASRPKSTLQGSALEKKDASDRSHRDGNRNRLLCTHSAQGWWGHSPRRLWTCCCPSRWLSKLSRAFW